LHLAENDAAGRDMETISALPSLGTLNDGSLASLSDDDLGSVGIEVLSISNLRFKS